MWHESELVYCLMQILHFFDVLLDFNCQRPVNVCLAINPRLDEYTHALIGMVSLIFNDENGFKFLEIIGVAKLGLQISLVFCVGIIVVPEHLM